jgi:hypothetical protein
MPRGRIDAPIGRDPTDRVRFAVVADGRPALTRYRTLAVGRASGAPRAPRCGRLAGLPARHRPHPPAARAPGRRSAIRSSATRPTARRRSCHGRSAPAGRSCTPRPRGRPPGDRRTARALRAAARRPPGRAPACRSHAPGQAGPGRGPVTGARRSPTWRRSPRGPRPVDPPDTVASRPPATVTPANHRRVVLPRHTPVARPSNVPCGRSCGPRASTRHLEVGCRVSPVRREIRGGRCRPRRQGNR